MEAALVMTTRDGGCRHFPLTKPRTIIGRGRDCSLRIALASVSHQHCEILLTEAQDVLARDMGSESGTQVNSKPVQEMQLKAGDEIVIGPVTFTLLIDGQPAGTVDVRTVISESETV